jgi:glycosyltransferase involved in cell wall biosynthesis
MLDTIRPREESVGKAGAERHGVVLVLAYHFPPFGGAGVQRMVQLSRRLPKLGWEQIVITGPGLAESRWRPHDETVGPRRGPAKLWRLPAPEPPHDVTWEGRLERWVRMSSRWRRWWAANAMRLAEKVGSDVDLVHASVAPYSTAESAVAVARLLEKPLLLDLEDPWALDEMMVYPTKLHRLIERRRMRRILRAADTVVMNTSEARRRVLDEFPEFSSAAVVAIPNAFESFDFVGTPPAPRSDGRFRVVHTGSLHTELGMHHRSASRLRRFLGGAVPGVDFLTRSHVYLLEAVGAVLEREEDLRGVLEVHLAGVFTAADRAVAARYPFVHLHEFLPHRETIAALRSADLLFLPMHNLPDGVRATIVPHKTYEYLAAGRPILAAVPDGDARDLLEASGVARLCRPSDVDGMAVALLAEVARWRSGSPRAQVRPEIVARCSSDRLTRDFTSLYETLAARSWAR